ncbi:MAG: hypothetical protein ACR2PZ_03050, partial [Pseudomonadales bacterium]
SESGGVLGIFRNLNRPLVKGAFLRDLIGTFTSIVGLCALLLYQMWSQPIFDALGALVAALLMLIGSCVLIAQARALITGRALPVSMLQQLQLAVLSDPRVHSVNRLAAIYAGASQILVEADLDLAESLATPQIEALLDELENRVRTILPDTERVRVQLNSPGVTS